VTHWLGAGEAALAATHAVPAASEAMAALAFDGAAELFAWRIGSAATSTATGSFSSARAARFRLRVGESRR